MAFIYVITNDINGKRYVGKTNDSVRKRFLQRIRESKRKRSEHRPLYKAFNKYGIDHFHVTVLEECSSDDASNREIYWIKKLDTYGSQGYNATRGGDSKHYLDYAVLARAYLKGESIKGVSIKYGCDEHTVSVACRSLGIDIMQSADRNRLLRSKHVIQCDKKNHNKIINTFNSITEAAFYLIENNLTGCKHSTIRTHISEVCRGKRKSAAGFYWEFKQ